MIELIQGDITQITVDAIVNAANTFLMGGGGVDGAIHRAGGPAILEECKKIVNRQGGCNVGKAVITTAGKLSAKYIIHTVGPIWVNGNNKEEELLASAYKNSLQLASQNQVESIAFPNISTGVYRFPKQKAANIATNTVKNFLKQKNSIKRVVFVCFDEQNYELYASLLAGQL